MNSFRMLEDAALQGRVERLKLEEQDLAQRVAEQRAALAAEGSWYKSDPLYQRLSAVLTSVRKDLRNARMAPAQSSSHLIFGGPPTVKRTVDNLERRKRTVLRLPKTDHPTRSEALYSGMPTRRRIRRRAMIPGLQHGEPWNARSEIALCGSCDSVHRQSARSLQYR